VSPDPKRKLVSRNVMSFGRLHDAVNILKTLGSGLIN